MNNFLDIAYLEAKKSLKYDDVPVGCVVVLNNKIIAKEHNKREKRHEVTAHAEILAINKASKRLKDWQLPNCEMYTTLEPCLMCTGAILQSKIKKIVIGCKNIKSGALGSNVDASKFPNLTYKPEIEFKNDKKCEELVKKFFANIRKRP